MKEPAIIARTQFIRFSELNYRLLFLSSSCIVRRLDTGVVIENHLSGDSHFLPNAGYDLFGAFERLLHGISYEDLLALLSSRVEDAESFIAELWQKGVIL